MSINTVLKPHKDRNTLERDNVIMGLSKLEGGQQLPAEDEKGNHFRVTKESEDPRPGVLRAGGTPSHHHSVRFNGAKQLHGTEPLRGSRSIATAYTPWGHKNATAEVLELLRDLGFQDEHTQFAAKAKPQQSKTEHQQSKAEQRQANTTSREHHDQTRTIANHT